MIKRKPINVEKHIRERERLGKTTDKACEKCIKRLKEKLLDYQYQTNPQLNEYCHANIIKQIDKICGLDNTKKQGDEE